MPKTNKKFISRDEINFYHYIGQPYPEINIAESEGRVFASLFRNKKAYVVLKSADMHKLSDVENVSAELFRKGVMLFVKLNFHTPQSENAIFTVLPIDAKLDDVAFPKYPSDDELMQFEVHLIDYFTEKLAKVIRFHIEAQDFQQELIDIYKEQKQATYERAIALLDTKAFLNTPFNNLTDFRILTTAASIEQQHPNEYEPKTVDTVDMLAHFVA